MASENFARYPAACCGELHYRSDPSHRHPQVSPRGRIHGIEKESFIAGAYYEIAPDKLAQGNEFNWKHAKYGLENNERRVSQVPGNLFSKLAKFHCHNLSRI